MVEPEGGWQRVDGKVNLGKSFHSATILVTLVQLFWTNRTGSLSNESGMRQNLTFNGHLVIKTAWSESKLNNLKKIK